MGCHSFGCQSKASLSRIQQLRCKVTIVFTDNQVGERYLVSDVKLRSSSWNGEEYSATSVKIAEKNGIVTVTLVFPHITKFSNPKVTLRVNGKKAKFNVCQ